MNNTLSDYIRSHDKRTLSLCEKRLNTKFFWSVFGHFSRIVYDPH